jgi:drug/metabolite transporter (DMT)-like permease
MYIILAALLWSLSGFFTRLLTHDTPVRLGPEPVSGLTISFYRIFFAGLVLVPTLRPRDISFRPMMLVMVGIFAVMNLTFVLAMAGGEVGDDLLAGAKSSNAILLQYTAPMWIYLASVCFLGESAERRGVITVTLGLFGIAVLVWGGWQEAHLPVIALGLASGLFYAGVIVCLRVLRDASSNWLTVLNTLGGALAVVPLLWYRGWPTMTGLQLGIVALFGAVQMGLPYWLVARGLRVVSPQEAGAITLLEPLLVPVWAYLVAPQKESPTVFTVTGGALILGALVWRYWPLRPTG